MAVLLAGCIALSCGGTEPRRAALGGLSELEQRYGELLTVANHPTPDQHGTGERLGIFRDANGTIWGIPLLLDARGNVAGCLKEKIESLPVTDTLPSDTAEIIGGTNTPTGWRGGTGELELVVRASDGKLRWIAVRSGDVPANEPACWAPAKPGPPQRLHYYRLAIAK